METVFSVGVHNLDYLSDMLIAAFCLHNFVLDVPFFENIDYEAIRQQQPNDEEDENCDDGNYAAHIKRDTIAAYFQPV